MKSELDTLYYAGVKEHFIFVGLFWSGFVKPVSNREICWKLEFMFMFLSQ